MELLDSNEDNAHGEMKRYRGTCRRNLQIRVHCMLIDQQFGS